MLLCHDYAGGRTEISGLIDRGTTSLREMISKKCGRNNIVVVIVV